MSRDPAALIAAVLALVGTGVLALVQLLGKRGETRLGLMELLQKDNADLRSRVAQLERRERALEAALRAANIPIPDVP